MALPPCFTWRPGSHAPNNICSFVANDADGYGIDRYLASGERCGSASANAYCRTQAFTAAAKYHKVDQDDLTDGPGPYSVDGRKT